VRQDDRWLETAAGGEGAAEDAVVTPGALIGPDKLDSRAPEYIRTIAGWGLLPLQRPSRQPYLRKRAQ
jgi:hypothetical protein